jgi:excisionase family DNA binding protein
VEIMPRKRTPKLDGIPNPFGGWTTIEEASEMLQRNNTTIRGWADRGRITCYMVGRKVRLVNLDEVRAYSEKHPPRTESSS